MARASRPARARTMARARLVPAQALALVLGLKLGLLAY